MLRQSVPLIESFSARGTHVRLVSGVNDHVPHPPVVEREPHPAELALVVPLAAVEHAVLQVGRLESEAPPADRADVRLRGGVDLAVFAEVAPAPARLAAGLALEQHPAGVAPHV